MKHIKVFLIWIVLAALAYAGGSRPIHVTKYAEFEVNDRGDTATVIYMIDFAALDSFTYADTFVVGPAFAESVYISWVSPLFMMTLTPVTTYGLDSMVLWDSICFTSGCTLGVAYTTPEYTYKITPRAYNTYAYKDTVIFAADTYTIGWTSDASATVAEATNSACSCVAATANLSDSLRCEDSTTYYVLRPVGPSHTWNRPTRIGTDTAQTGAVSTAMTVAKACSTLAALINAETNLTDSITAQDSGTYVKLISNFGSDKFGGRWTQICSDSTLDTAIHAQVCSTGMVVDSMVATFNAEDTLSKYATATASDDTAWIITSDDIGLDIKLFLADTAQDSSRTQANVTSSSTRYDTLINYPIAICLDDFRGLGYSGDIILDHYSLADTLYGLGISDSATIWLKTYKVVAGNKVFRDLDSAICADIPCTLHVARVPVAANDTLFYENLIIMYYVSDTLSDTNMYRRYPIYIDFHVSEL